MANKKNKYNAKKIEIDGFIFDSKIEGDYYLLLKRKLEEKEIAAFSLNPQFTLLEPFVKFGKKIRGIKYTADFKVRHLDGSEEIIDIKGGMVSLDFPLRKKLFDYNYPHLKLSIVKYVKKFGGWVTDEEYKRLKRQEKKKG